MRDIDVLRARRRDVFARVRASLVAIVDETPFIRDLANRGLGPIAAGVSHPPERLRVLATGVRLNERGLIVTAARPFTALEERARQNPQVGRDEFVYLNYVAARQTDTRGDGTAVRVDTVRARFTGAAAVREDLGLALLDSGDRVLLDRLGTRPLVRAPSRCADGDEVGVCGFATDVDPGEMPAVESLVPWFSTAIVSSSTGAQDVGTGGFDRHFRLHALLHQGYLGAPVFDVTTGEWIGLVTDPGNVDGSGERPRGFVSCTDVNVLTALEADFDEVERRLASAPRSGAPLTWVPLT